MISILILTLNEEMNLPECLESVKFSDDVVVLDSYSSDRTIDIARQYGARIVEHKFENWAAHQNWAHQNIPFKHPWVLYVDADERVTPELREEVLAISRNPQEKNAAFYLGRKNYFMGKWIRHAMPPGMLMRFFRPEKVRFERVVNPIPIIDGTHGYLKKHLIHYNFSKGLVDWFTKHNKYSQLEAVEGMKVLRQKNMSALQELRGLSQRDDAARRRAMKNLSFRIPGRSLFRFLHVYFFKGGFLDGAAGFAYATLISIYEYWTSLKIFEMQANWRARSANVVARLMTQSSAISNAQPQQGSDPTEARIDVMIPTLNEADHIVEAVTSARALGNVYVLDSHSTDGTQELARNAGATVVENTNSGYARQKNWGLDNLPLTGHWVLILDADERVTSDVVTELQSVAAANGPVDGYFVNRLTIFMGQRLNHGGQYPAWNLRFFRRGRARYEDRAVHEHMICSGPTAYLKHHLLHVRRETMSKYIAKHIRYADLESDEWLKWRQGQSREAAPQAIFSHSLRYRQYVRRSIWPRLPLRPMGRFIYMFIFKFGFLDGTAGLHIALLLSSYEQMITLLFRDKLREAREQSVINPPTAAPAPATLPVPKAAHK